MKLVIDTQLKENYGAHTWNGKGECPQSWRFKGGTTFVVRNLTESHIQKIEKDGIPTLKKLIEFYDDYYEEYIIHYCIVDDDEKECEDWDSPFVLSYNKEEAQWEADRFVKADDHWTPGYEGKQEHYVLGPSGEQNDRVSDYIKKAA